MMAQKQPATETLQKWILFSMGVIITALGAGNIQMMSIHEELGSLNSTVIALVKVVDGNGARILRLENLHFSGIPKRKEPQISQPIEALPTDRRKLRIEE
jgi:hypothetical protein